MKGKRVQIDINKKYGRLTPIVCVGSVKGFITWVCSAGVVKRLR